MQPDTTSTDEPTAVHAPQRCGLRRAARRHGHVAPLAALAGGVALLTLAGSGGWVAASAPPGSGTLVVTGKVELGAFNSLALETLVDAEAPDGTFYFATGATVQVVHADAPPALMLHATGKVQALAATTSDLYVQSGLTVTDYSLSAGKPRRSWTLPRQRFAPDGPPTSAGLLAAGGVVWSWTDFSTDQSGFEFADIDELETAAAAPRPIDANAYPADLAADSSGLYYEDTVGSAGYLVHVTPAGTKTRSKPTADMDAPMLLSDGSVFLAAIREPSGTPYLDRFSETTLALLGSVRLHANLFAVSTSAGVLTSCDETGCAADTVVRIDPSTAASTGSVVVPGLAALVSGSQPATLATLAGHGYLVRLGTTAGGSGVHPLSPPVLGSKSYRAPEGAGWGTVEPRTINNGGDPTGIVEDLSWKQWGATDAYGYGKSFIERPGGGFYPLVDVELRASDLGHCTAAGPLAYEQLAIRVPARPGAPLGGWIPWGGSGSICTTGG